MKTGYDALVIGGGMAGCAAALSARRRFGRVLLISNKPGATHLCGGAFDIDGDPAKPRTAAAADNHSFEANLLSISLTNRLHPYGILGGPKRLHGFEDAIRFFRDALGGQGLQPGGSMNGWLLLISNLGTMKRARYALPGLAEGNISDPAEMRVAVFGFDGLNEFNAAFVARAADAAAKKVFGRGFAKIDGFEMQLPSTEGFTNLTPFQIADMFDEHGFAEKAAAAIKEFLPANEFTHVAFPAVIGLNRANEALSILRRSLGMRVFEIATVQPSVPGLRLAGALQGALDKAGVETFRANVTGFSANDGKITGIRSETTEGITTDHETERVVLATGKFIGGGIKHDGRLREPVFDLPVFVKDRPVGDTILMDLVTERITDRQELFASGVRVDGLLRPLGADGVPVYENLRCAGSVIGGYDPMFDRCGAGVSIITGVLAGNFED